MSNEKKVHKKYNRFHFATLLKYLFLCLVAFFILYPLYLVVVDSFRTNTQIMMDPFGLPESFSLENYTKAWEEGMLYALYGNSALVTFVSVLLIVLFSSLIGFVMTRKDFRFHKALLVMFILGMTVPFQVGIIPLYLQMSDMNLTDNLLGLIIIYVVSYLSFSTYLMYGFMKGIPAEIQEAAEIDGVSTFGMYRHIMMPLSPAIITTVAIQNLMYVWNDMFYALVMMTSKTKKTLTIGLLAFKGQYMSDYATMFAGVVLVSLPMIILFFLLQKRFIEGVAAGAVKG